MIFLFAAMRLIIKQAVGRESFLAGVYKNIKFLLNNFDFLFRRSLHF